jgi:MFS superfamily sulfate permease-like transporter
MNFRAFRPEFLRQDLASGFVVFLVALPLCLGISLASEVPLMSGLITGIVAGILVSLLSGSELSVSGPAAGLTMTVIAGQQAIGSLEGLLVATALSGVLQLVLGFFRAGLLATFFPSSVIKGMLAGIGIIIAFKQIPHAFGWHEGIELEESIFCVLSPFCVHSTISSLSDSLKDVTFLPIAITLASIALLLWWEKMVTTGRQFFKIVPGALAAVVLGLIINSFIEVVAPSLALQHDAGHLVQIPPINSWGDLSQFAPTLSSKWLLNTTVWGTAMAIALIGSIETLLCIEATDKLDPLKRVSRPNRELTAQGIGNIIAGLMGGIPMTSVIVRSSANIYAGGRTRLAAFTHGVLLLVSVLLIPQLLNQIPIATLAGILMLVGYKLANIKLIRQVYASGLDQFLPFLVTMLGVVIFDLLTGVAIGAAVGLLVVLRMNHHAAFTIVNDDNNVFIRFAKDVSFLQKVSVKKCLARIPDHSNVLIDGGGAMFIDHDILEIIESFKESAVNRHITVSVRNIVHSRPSLFSS